MAERKLTEKQKAFCDYYIETLNAAEAARRAGYSPNCAKEMGRENLTKPHVKEFVEERLAQLESERIAGPEEVLEFLTTAVRDQLDPENLQHRLKAAELLGKRYAMFTDKIQESGNVNVNFNIPRPDRDREQGRGE